MARNFEGYDAQGKAIYSYDNVNDPDYIKDVQGGVVNQWREGGATVPSTAPSPLQKGIHTVLGGVGNFADTATSFLFPRIKETAGKAIRQELPQKDLYESTLGIIPPFAMAKYGVDVARKKKTYTTETLPAMMEAGSYVLPGLAFKGLTPAMPLLKKIGLTAIPAGIAGLGYGATEPGDLSLVERAKKGVQSGLTSAAFAGGTTAALHGLSKIPQIMQSAGKYLGGRTIKPEVDFSMHFPRRMQRDIEVALSKTGASVTPEGMAQQVSNYYDDLSAKINQRLQENAGKRVPVKQIEEIVKQTLVDRGLFTDTATAMGPKGNPALTDAVKMISDAINRNKMMTGGPPVYTPTPEQVQAWKTKPDKIVEEVVKRAKETAFSPKYEKAGKILNQISELDKQAGRTQKLIDRLQDKLDMGKITKTEFGNQTAGLKARLTMIQKTIEKLDDKMGEPVITEGKKMLTKLGETAFGANVPKKVWNPQASKMIEETINPQDILRAKLEIGKQASWKMLPDTATPEQIAQNQALKTAYRTLTNVLEKVAPDTSYLTEQQSALYDIQEGLYKELARRIARSGTSMNPLQFIPGLMQMGQTGLAKALYNLGIVGEDMITSPTGRAFMNVLGTLGSRKGMTQGEQKQSSLTPEEREALMRRFGQ